MERLSLDALFVGRPGDDEATRGARVASAMYVGAGLVVLLTLPLLRAGIERGPIAASAVAALAFGLVIPWLPWTRWGAEYLVWLPLPGYVILAVMGLLVPGAIAIYMPAYSLTFVYVGLVRYASARARSSLTRTQIGAAIATWTQVSPGGSTFRSSLG